MEEIRKLFRNKDKPVYKILALVLALGALFMVISPSFFKRADVPEEGLVYEESPEPLAEYVTEQERQLETRLQNILAQIEGVGKVLVMITFSDSKELVLAEDKSLSESRTTETDAQGGSRQVENKTADSKTIIISGAQGQKPLILKEIEPKANGVVIVCEGGGNVVVKEALISAAKTILGVEAHRVSVYKMKSE